MYATALLLLTSWPHISQSHSPTSITAIVKEYSQHTIGVEFSSRVIRDGDRRVKLQVRSTNLIPHWNGVDVQRIYISAGYSSGILRDKNDSDP